MIRTQRTLKSNRAAGFTLVELLVVIAIIAILSALTAGAVFKVIGVQRSNNTQLTVKTVSSLLDKNWAAVIRDHQNDIIPANVLAIAGNDPVRGRVIWIKLNLKREFPMNLTEAIRPWSLPSSISSPIIQPQDLPAKPGYLAAIQRAVALQIPPAMFNPSTDPTIWPLEGAFTLVMSLQQNRGGNGFAEENFAVNALSTDIFSWTGTPAQQGVSPILSGPKMLVDSWTVPLVLYRWPVGNSDFQSSITANLDPLDPQGTLMDPRWNNYQNWTSQGGVWWFEMYCHAVHTGNTTTSYQPFSSNLEPVIVSAGPDHLFGVQAPAAPNLPDPMTVNTLAVNAWFDNIASYKLRLGATGDK